MSQAASKKQDAHWENDLVVLNSLKQSQAYIEFTLEGKIIDANDIFLAEMGYLKQEVLGFHHSMLVEPDYTASIEYKHFWRDLSHGKAQQQEFARIKKTGEKST